MYVHQIVPLINVIYIFIFIIFYNNIIYNLKQLNIFLFYFLRAILIKLYFII